jgi:hypothetical protein
MLRKVLMIFLGATSSLLGEIHSIDSLQEMAPHLKNAGSESLIVFDIDETLTIPDHPAFQRANFEVHRPVIREVIHKLDPQKRTLLINTIFLVSKPLLIEEKTPSLIRAWQKQGIKTMALSSAMSGKIEDVDLLEMRLNNFEKIGIDFSSTFPNHEELVFSDHNVYYGSSSRFRKGVLHTNSCHQTTSSKPEKGEILIRFLKEVNCTPKKIFFADDKLELLQEVEKTLREIYPGVKFIGFHYQGALHFPTKILDAEELKADWEKLIEKTNSLSMSAN